MEVKLKNIYVEADNIICSQNMKLSTIMQEIDNDICDAFKTISICRQREDKEDNNPYDALEEVEGILCEIQELIQCIK